jgi:hypothetical protein
MKATRLLVVPRSIPTTRADFGRPLKLSSITGINLEFLLDVVNEMTNI